jgi:hypothetical protein
MMKKTSILRSLPKAKHGGDSNIAFKAQSQSRRTLAILAELKRPCSTMFINQQNNALVQQVNNRDNAAKSEKNKNISNELLSEDNHEALESRGTQKTIRVNPDMATMEKNPQGLKRHKANPSTK